jgi:branched-chain amino acid aminotransferase
VLHYAQEIFEGLKAYRAPDGGVVSFRADANAHRFRDSAVRMAMPPLPEELFLGSINELVRIDREWIPTDPEGSLYLRPFMFASEVFLGVKPASEYLYVVIASPVGSYFKSGVKPVSIWISTTYTRAAPGGTGAAKCGGNYATSLIAQAEAAEHGCDQVVFLDTAENRYVDELGGMNVFFVFDDGSLATPPLTGTILPGITRDALITLARAEGRTVVERPVSVDEWRDGARSGRLTEVFACGTAAVITPIGTVRSHEGEFAANGGEPRPGRHRTAPAAGRHPAGPGRGPVRLGAPHHLTQRGVRSAGRPYASRWARIAATCSSVTPTDAAYPATEPCVARR